MIRLKTPMAIVGYTSGKPDIIPYKNYLRRIAYGYIYHNLLPRMKKLIKKGI